MKVLKKGVKPVHFYFHCPGCKTHHAVGEQWTFNGDYHAPTFHPSVLVTWDMKPHGLPNKICHSFVKDGFIQFLGDCSHELKGKTVKLPDVDESMFT